MATDAEAIAAGFDLPTGTDLISLGDNAITKNAKTALDLFNEAKWVQRTLGNSDHMDNIKTPGLYKVLNGATATTIGLPLGAVSSVEVLPVGTTVIQRQTGTAPNDQVWQRSLYANGVVWGNWWRSDFHTDSSQVRGLSPAMAAGFKTVAVPCSLGYGGAQTTGQGFSRSLQRMPAAGTRARIRLRNWNPRYNMADSPAVALTNISIGNHNGGNSQSTGWITVAASASTGTDGYVSAYFTVPASMANRDVLVAFGWQSSGDVQQNIGYGFTGPLAANAIIGTGTGTNVVPLFVAIEVEVPSTQPVVANFADSIGSGVSASKVVYDSWLDQWARANGVVPTHWSHSGDQGSSWLDPTGKKWSLYGTDIALADAVFYAMGSNLIFTPTTPTLQECIDTVMANVESIRKHISPNVYGCTITPRSNVTGAGETLRRQFNAWMKTSPLFKDVFDMSAAVSADDETLRPEFDADGIHLNTAGYAAMAAAITRPVVPTS